MQDITGTEHVDRLPVILSENNEFQLLGEPKMESGTGSNTAHAVYQSIIDWGLEDNIVAFSFDTTSVNTGRLAGFESKFGSSSAPFPLMFKRFKDAWKDLNQNDFEAGITDPAINSSFFDIIPEITVFCKNELKKKSVRADYEELLQLCITFLGDRSRCFPFRAPAGMSNARWISKVIYCLKMYMFKSQFQLTPREKKAMRDFIIFVIRFYIKAWFTSTSAI